jgi:hypothetical protein
VVVAEERHFGRAAARLHMTQPPLSRAIKQLETDPGALLVHRSAPGVTLTPAGTALYDDRSVGPATAPGAVGQSGAVRAPGLHRSARPKDRKTGQRRSGSGDVRAEQRPEQDGRRATAGENVGVVSLMQVEVPAAGRYRGPDV